MEKEKKKRGRKVPPLPEPSIVTTDGFMRARQIIGGDQPLFPVSEYAWGRGVSEGYYPPAYQIGPKMIGFRTRHVMKLLADGPALDADGNVILNYWADN